MYEFCKKETGKYNHLCTKELGHNGSCSDRAYATNMLNDQKIIEKILRDTYITPGNTTSKAVKNRANRCYRPAYTKLEIEEVNKHQTNCCIIKKFSSTPQDVFDIHISLVNDTLKMENGKISKLETDVNSSLTCFVCKEEIFVENFYSNKMENNHINIGHIDPKPQDIPNHISGNVAWVHRQCNSIQGDMPLSILIEYVNKISLAHK